jgi:sortase A
LAAILYKKQGRTNMGNKAKRICGTLLLFFGIFLIITPFVILKKGEDKNQKIIELFEEQKEKQRIHKKNKIDSEKSYINNSKKTSKLPKGILGIITIEKINIQYPIVEGSNGVVLSNYIGHMTDTPRPGEKGNCVLAGHRGGKNGIFFKDLDQVRIGDEIKIVDSKLEYSYLVSEIYVTNPEDTVNVKKQSKEFILTLLTCTNAGKDRLIIRCIIKK